MSPRSFGLYSTFLLSMFLITTPPAFASWAKKGFLNEDSDQRRSFYSGRAAKTARNKSDAVKFNGKVPSVPVTFEASDFEASGLVQLLKKLDTLADIVLASEPTPKKESKVDTPVTFEESDFEVSEFQQLHKKLDTLMNIFLVSESSPKKVPMVDNEEKASSLKGGFFVTPKPVENPTSQVIQATTSTDKFAQMRAPKLWTVDKLKDHPSCKKTSQDKLAMSKRGLWFFDLFEGQKFFRYLKIAMSCPPYSEVINPETFMVSFNELCDMRLALLYTLKLCEPGLPILDLGSGYGMMARNMLVLGAHVTLVDHSKFSLEQASKHFQQHQEFLPPNYKTLYRLIKSNIYNANAPYYKNKYWMVTCEQVLHFGKPEEIHSLLDSAYDVLYPGGLFFASVINIFQCQEIVDLYLEGRKQGKEFPLPGSTGPASMKSIYTIYLALEELTALIKKHGFIIEEAFNVGIDGDKTEKSCLDINCNGISSCVIARKPMSK